MLLQKLHERHLIRVTVALAAKSVAFVGPVVFSVFDG